jgi:hypothetical protein
MYYTYTCRHILPTQLAQGLETTLLRERAERVHRRALLVLFLVEKSPVNINCLLACVSAGSKKTSKTDFEKKTFLDVIRCGEFESAVGFNKLLTNY